MSILPKAGLAAVALLATTLYASAQVTQEHSNMPDHGTEDPARHGFPPHADMMRMHRQMMEGQGGLGPRGMMQRRSRAATQPHLPGQDAFGAIQEVVRLLEADPDTDWSKVDIAGLREHLIDMNEVTIHAVASQRPLDNGVEISVTGEGRVLDGIRRMVPAHARELNGTNDWSVKTEDLPNGVRLTVTASDAKQVPKLQALGFMGLMVQGAHHRPHHLAIASGRFRH